MDCKRAELALHEWLEGETDPQEASELTSHLAECSDCRAYETKARQIKQLLAEASPPVASRSLDYRVMSSFLSYRSTERSSSISLWLRRVFQTPRMAFWCLFAVLIGGLAGAFQLGRTLGQAEVRGFGGAPNLKKSGQPSQGPLLQADKKGQSVDLKDMTPTKPQRAASNRVEQKVTHSAAVQRAAKRNANLKDAGLNVENDSKTPAQAAVVLPAGFEPILEPTIRILGRHKQ